MYFNCDYDKKIVEYNVTCPDKVCKFKIPFTYVTTTSLKSYNTANVTWYDEREKKLFLDLNINFFFLANMEQVGKYRLVSFYNLSWFILWEIDDVYNFMCLHIFLNVIEALFLTP